MNEKHIKITSESGKHVESSVTYYDGDIDLEMQRKCCMICNSNFEETCWVLEFHCKHIFHQDCLNKMYNPVACAICCGDFVFNEAAGKYDCQLQWLQRWEEMYGSLCVWMNDHLKDRVRTVEIDTSLCEHHCTFANNVGAFVISPWSHGFKSLKALLDNDLVVSLRYAVDGLFAATIRLDDGRLPIYDPMGMKYFGEVDHVLEEHEQHLTTMKALTGSLEKKLRSELDRFRRDDGR